VCQQSCRKSLTNQPVPAIRTGAGVIWPRHRVSAGGRAGSADQRLTSASWPRRIKCHMLSCCACCCACLASATCRCACIRPTAGWWEASPDSKFLRFASPGQPLGW